MESLEQEVHLVPLERVVLQDLTEHLVSLELLVTLVFQEEMVLLVHLE